MSSNRARLIDRLLLGPNVPDRVRGELVAMLYPPSFRIGTSMICSIVCAAVLAAQMQSTLPLVWGAVAFVLCLLRAYDWLMYRRLPQMFTPERWARRFTLQFLPFGMWWGLLTAVLFLTDDPIAHSIAVMAIVAMCSGAVCSYFCHPPAALAFTLPSMAMFAIGGAVFGGWFGFSVVFIQVVLGANYMLIIREFYGATILSLRVQHEKAALAENLAVARAEAEREVYAKSQFLATLSHEIRTPMNAVLGALQMLERAPLQHADRGMLDVALRGGARLAALIDDTLDLERINAGAMPLEAQPFDPRQVVEEPVRLMRAEADRKHLWLRLRVEPPHLRAIGDARRLEQVVLNLVANAVRYTPSGSVEISLSTTAVPDLEAVDLLLAVADTGPGIAADLKPRLFQPFARGSVHGESGSGTGLGLSIVERLISAMGGTVTCESAPNNGTRFEIRLRLPLAPTISAEVAPAERPEPARLDHRVLLVEDDELSRIVARALLERLGCRVQEASSGETALALAQHSRFDVVLLDMQLPGIDGLTAARALRDRYGHQLRIVAMTANATLSDRTRYANEGLDGFVAKPIRLDVLRATIEDGSHRVPDTADTATKPMYDEELWARLVRDFPAGEAKAFRDQARTVLAERLLTLQELRTATPEELIRPVHALAGSAASAGLPALAEAASQLELHLTEGRPRPIDLDELCALGVRAMALLAAPLPAAAAVQPQRLRATPGSHQKTA